MQQGPGPRSKAPFIVAAIVGLILISVVRSAFTGDKDTVADDTPVDFGDCLVVNMAASSEKAALLKEIATEFHKENPKSGDQCGRMNIYSKSSGGAAEALARGWDDVVDGTKPDVWSPASSSWTVILRQRLAAKDAPNIVPASFTSVAQTPLVIAMPRPMAEALGWPKKPIGWADVIRLSQDPTGWGSVGHAEWGRFRLGKTNPNFSTSGLNATIGAYFAATGVSSDLTVKQVQSAKVRTYVKNIESSVVHYGDITLTFLQNLLDADDRGAGLTYISAVTVEEKSVWDYNKGNPSGDPATLGDHKAPKTPLVAVYPKEGTLLSDNPFVVLDAPWVDSAKKDIAAKFQTFLQKPDQQARFQKNAFRDFKGRPGAEINERNGLLPKQPVSVISPPAPEVLDTIQKSWAELRKRARVTLVIDVSGSMGQSVASAGETKLELAKRAAIKALDQFAADDQLSLWIFSSDFPATKNPYLELLPMQKLGPKLKQYKDKIGALVPEGGTALYATARAVTRDMRRGFLRDRINAVVLLTDGKNEYDNDNNIDSLLRELRSESEDTTIRVFPIGYGEDADLGTLEKIAEASRGASYDASDPTSIDKIFTAVVSNF